MDKTNHRLIDLLKKYVNGTIDDAEQEELNKELASSDSKQEIFEYLINGGRLMKQLSKQENADPGKGWEKLRPRLVNEEKGVLALDQPSADKPVKGKRWTVILTIAAACIAVIGAIVLYAILKQPSKSKQVNPDIVSKSRESSFESKKVDLVVDKRKVTHANSSHTNSESDYVTIKTDSTDKRMVRLPDGSQVWLNGGSSIRYPRSFAERKVIMSGEAYFEIVRNKKKPFFYVSWQNDYTIKVTGTSFNVNIPQDMGTARITLLTGTIHVGRQDDSSSFRTLEPNQQMQIFADGHTSIVNAPKPEEVLTWKNEKFNFDNTNLKNIMKQIERWYDIELVFDSAAPNPKLSGRISRSTSLPEVLDFLRELAPGAKFEQERKKIIVKRKND